MGKKFFIKKKNPFGVYTRSLDIHLYTFILICKILFKLKAKNNFNFQKRTTFFVHSACGIIVQKLEYKSFITFFEKI